MPELQPRLLGHRDIGSMAGPSTDPYEVFRRLLRQGRIGADFEASYRQWLDENPDLRETVAGEISSAETAAESPRRRSRDKPQPS